MQFGERYRLQVKYAQNPGREKKRRFLDEEQVRIQRARPVRPSNMKYFEDLALDVPAKIGGKLRVGYFCNLVPQEVIAAAGAQPVRLDCGNSVSGLSGEEIFAGEICPLSKATLGSFLSEGSLADTCDVLVVPTGCDAKKKMGEILKDIKPVFMLNLPVEQDHELYAGMAAREIRRLEKFLEAETKARKLPWRYGGGELLRAVELYRERTDIVRKLQAARAAEPRALSAADLFLMVQVSQFRPLDMREWQREAGKVLEETKAWRADRRSLRPRIILTGAPMVWPNFKVLNVLDECGADVVADTLCTGAQSAYDPVVTDEKSHDALVRALADRYFFAAICPCFISQETRINRVLDLAREAKADGVVNYSLRLCPLFDVENYRLEKVVKAEKIPYMNVRTDYSQEDTEQLRVRIEAFLETIQEA